MSSSRKPMVKWGAGARSPSPSPRRSPSPSPRRSPSPSPRRSSTPVRRSSSSQNSKFSPRTTSDLTRREAKVNRRRLQAEAKAHKFAMQQQRQETRHAKRTQDLEYAIQHKEAYGMTPTTKYGIMAAVAGVIGFIAFQQI
jgi:hypothetical protein